MLGDADANGLLSLAEARTVVPSLSEADFSALDRNNDGNFSEGERAAIRAPTGGCVCPGKAFRPVSLQKTLGDEFLLALALGVLAVLSRRGGSA